MPGEAKLYPCCADRSNRVLQPPEREDEKFERCGVCNRRHFEITVDPVKIGLKVGEI